MSYPLFHGMRCTAVGLLFLFSAMLPLASSPGGSTTDPLESVPAAQAAHKFYFSWNPFDLVLTGRLSLGAERILRAGHGYMGFYVQYTSPMNSVFDGFLTSRRNGAKSNNENPFPRTVDFYFHYYGKGRTRAIRYFPRLGLSFVKNPGEKELAGYLAFGPCARACLGDNFHLIFALTTLKFKLWGNPDYNWVQFPFLEVMIGVNC